MKHTHTHTRLLFCTYYNLSCTLLPQWMTRIELGLNLFDLHCSSRLQLRSKLTKRCISIGAAAFARLYDLLQQIHTHKVHVNKFKAMHAEFQIYQNVIRHAITLERINFESNL